MAKKDIESRIISVEEAEPHIKVLVYGRHGSGKTRFAASAPNCLILDINERGTRSARGSGAKVIRINQWEDIQLAYWYLKKREHDFETIAIDTITAMQQLCMTHVLRESAERDVNKPPKTPSQRDWGTVAELMKGQLLNYRNLPYHIVFTAQERVLGDEDSEEVLHVPDLSKAPRAVALGAVGVIGRLYRKEVRTVKKVKGKAKEATKWETRMLVGDHENFETKDRTYLLGNVIRNPSMREIIAANEASEQEE